MNHTMLVGRLVADPEVRYTQSNMAVARFRIAVDRRVKQEGQQTADFIPCKAFNKTAEFIEKYFNKGRRIGITGRLNSGDYTDKDGKKVYYIEVIADEVEFVDYAQQKPKDDIDSIPDLDEQLPFN